MAKVTEQARAMMIKRIMDTKTAIQLSPKFSAQANADWLNLMVDRMIHYSDYPWKRGVTE